MANLFITNTAKFKPFSFQEMLQPYMIYTEAYNKNLDEIENLNLMTADIESKLDSEYDKALIQEYNTFKEDLNTAMNELYDKGLTQDTRKKLANLKGRYTNKLNPINTAYEAYKKDQEYLEKMAIEHPEILIEGVGKGVSDYIGGKRPSMWSVSADDYMNEALNLAKSQAKRTYNESDWTPTAGGKFLQRTEEVGLTDDEFTIAFSKALTSILNPKEDIKLDKNDLLIKDSLNTFINSDKFKSLSTNNQSKALDAIKTGFKAGFTYDKKTHTEDNPDYAHNLALEREEIKTRRAAEAAAKKERDKALSNIGSSTYRATNLGKTSVDAFLTKNAKGEYVIKDAYKDFFNAQNASGQLLSREYLERTNKEKRGDSPFKGMAPQFSFYNSGYNLLDYDELYDTISKLGLDAHATREEVIKRMVDAANEPDAFGRKRASIKTLDDELITRYVKTGLGDNKLKEVEGFEKDKSGIFRYKTKEEVSISDLLNKSGNLNILSVDMDYVTGERTFTVEDNDGDIREFKMPEDASFESEDQLLLNANTAKLRELESNIALGQIIDDGKTIYKTRYGNITASDYREMLQDDLDLTFASILNYMGKKNINQ